MTFLFLTILTGAWLAVLIPALWRARKSTPLSTSKHFKKRMNLMAPPRATSSGRWVLVPEAQYRLQRALRKKSRRRAQLAIFLALAALGTAIGAVTSGGWLWEVNVLCDLALALYLVLLREGERRRREAVAKVRPLHSHRAPRQSQTFEPLQRRA